jgi:crotonobetainyl-CoA:carnitine CoA-transferase CaiB-like acyl-CoA transferase
MTNSTVVPATRMPLEGIRVIDLTTVLSGPLCTMMLGDAGADVIKVEPPGGDPSRRMGPPFVGDEGGEFIALNRNKRSVVLDLKSPEGRAHIEALIRTADVLVENYRTGVTERLGIGYERAKELNPRLVYCSISGFGRTGPRAEEPAYDAIMQAFVGMMAATGEPGGSPVRANISVCDISAAMYSNQAILLALRARELTGEGQWVESSMFESQIAWLLYRAVGYFATGEAPVRKMGSAAPHVVPYQAYRTEDDWIIMGALNDKLYGRLVRAMDLGELADNPRFATNPDRVKHREELNRILQARLLDQPTKWWVERFTQEGVPHSPLNTVEDVLNDPQTAARDMVATVQHPTIGEIRMPGIPIKLRGTPGSIRRHPPMLGEHQDEVLASLADEPAATSDRR